MFVLPGTDARGDIRYPVNRAEYRIKESPAVIQAVVAQVGNKQYPADQQRYQESRAEVGFFDK